MTLARICRMAAAGCLLAAVIACGHKGSPVPPDRPEPPAVEAFAIDKIGSAVTLHFTVPVPGADDTAPRLLERVEVYALSKPAADPSPTRIEIAVPAHLFSKVDAPVPPKPSASTPATAELVSGALTVTDNLSATAADASSVRYYAVQAVNGRRRGPLSPILKVPMATTLDVPANVAATYDERTLSLSWTGSAGAHFVLDETDAAGAKPNRVTPAPLEAAKFEGPVEFGKARCFVVRAVQVSAGVTVIGEGAPPVCVTPVDKFPPTAPTDAVALAVDGGVEVTWTASTASDVKGYIILRAEGANGTLQPLTPQPVPGPQYRDATARSGVTYQYAIKAVDGAGNESAASNRYTVTARGER